MNPQTFHRTVRRASLAAVFVCLQTAAQAQTSGRNETIARTGESAPIDGTFSSFTPPTLNGSGQAAFGAGTTDGPATGVYLGSVASVARVAAQGETAPGGGVFGALDSTAVVINSSGQIAFLAPLVGTASGIYLETGLGLSRVARSGDTSPAGGTFTDFFSPAINSLGQTAFLAHATGGPSFGVFFKSGAITSRIAVEGGGAPGGGSFVGFSVSPLNGAGQTAFRSDVSGGPGLGIYRGSIGGVSRIAAMGAGAPGGGTYSNFGLPMLNSSGEVVFFSTLTGGPGSGIYLGSPTSVNAVALVGGTAPGGGTFTSLSPFPVVNNESEVAFSANNTTGQAGIYVGPTAALLQRVARQGASAPGGGTFLNFFEVTLNEPGAAAFFANLTSGGQGIYLGDGRDLLRAVASGNALAGSTVTAVALAGNAATGRTSLNDRGQVAYRAFLANGSSGIFIFTPTLRWRTPASGEWNMADHWTLGINPAEVHDVVIDPAVDLTVIGPNDDTTVRSLRVGGGAGTATLELLPGVTLSVSEGATVSVRGVLAGDGTIEGEIANSGRVSPGTVLENAGTLSVVGNFAQASGGSLAIELGGATAGTDYDSLLVSGAATLGGTLAVTLTGGFVPALGDTFDVLTAASIGGTFANLALPTLAGRKILRATVGAQTVQLSVDLIVTFEEWRANHFTSDELANPAISGPAADPDDDGLGNRLEYFFGAEPKLPEARAAVTPALVTESGEQFITLSFSRAQGLTDTTLSIERSTDLDDPNGWTPASFEIVSAVPTDCVDALIVRILEPIADLPAQFFRLRLD